MSNGINKKNIIQDCLSFILEKKQYLLPLLYVKYVSLILLFLWGFIFLAISFLVLYATLLLAAQCNASIFILVPVVLFFLYKYFGYKIVGYCNALQLNALDVGHESSMRYFSELKYGLKYLVCYFLYSTMTFIGFLFLLVPGIFLSARFRFAIYIMLEQDCSIMQAFKYSWNISRGYGLVILFSSVFPILILLLKVLGFYILNLDSLHYKIVFLILISFISFIEILYTARLYVVLKNNFIEHEKTNALPT